MHSGTVGKRHGDRGWIELVTKSSFHSLFPGLLLFTLCHFTPVHQVSLTRYCLLYFFWLRHYLFFLLGPHSWLWPSQALISDHHCTLVSSLASAGGRSSCDILKRLLGYDSGLLLRSDAAPAAVPQSSSWPGYTHTQIQTHFCRHTLAETPRNSDYYLMFSSRPLFCSNTLMLSSVMSSALHA